MRRLCYAAMAGTGTHSHAQWFCENRKSENRMLPDALSAQLNLFIDVLDTGSFRPRRAAMV